MASRASGSHTRLAHLLSLRLGDLWSSVAFIPFWGIVYLVIQCQEERCRAPNRHGATGHTRQTRLTRFKRVMLAVNLLALILGIVAAMTFRSVPGEMISIGFGLLLLIVFSTAGILLGFRRLHIYALLVGLSPLVGEWLYTHHNAAHHGFPITFGTAARIMFLVGLALFIRLLRRNPLPTEEIPPGHA